VDVVRPTARARGVTLVVELPRVRCMVEGDAARLQQVVWNLLTNAVKFTSSGGSVTASVRSEGRTAVVSVTDTGAGITPQFLPFVFERFRQADGSLTREQGGLGLGLAIVKELTELHGGTVSARSDGLGTGATFEVRLPVIASERPSPRAERDEAPLPSLQGVHVLAVDDNLDALDLIVASLTAAGARVSIAQDGQHAVQQWAEQPADVLLCDLAMPHMSGFDVLERIREIDARAGRFTPALAISAHASEDQQARSLRAGFLQHVVKPFHPRDLIRMVADVVARA
jgi:CheY-like chemotaxis protein